MRLSITSDNLSLDLGSALEIANDYQCKEMELRGLGMDVVPDAAEGWLELADKAIQTKRLRVTALSPGLFADAPCPLGRYTVEQNAVFERLFALAKRLNCTALSMHAFLLGEGEAPEERDDETIDIPDHIITALGYFVTMAEHAGCEVWLRPAPDTWASTTPEALALIKAIGAPKLGLDWDIAACVDSGDGTGLDYIEDVQPVLKCIHVADVVRKGLTADRVSLGKGVIPWEDILEQLHAGGFKGPAVLAPGVTPKLREARTAIPQLARWIEACRAKPRGERDD